MASQLPARLKSLDVSRFAMRAAQLEKLKPYVAYWCYYHIANRVLSSGLHNADEECKTYTGMLLDKLESMKTQYPSDATIHDDQAARQAIAEFGLATFERADKARRAYSATRQTADTYLAACTFLELLKTWDTEEDPHEDIAGKIKAAKYHALRIANALKAGKDPNERPPEPQQPVLSEDDPEVQAINAAAARQPTVEELPDEDSYYNDLPQRSPALSHFQNPTQNLPPSDTLYPSEPKPDSFQPSPISTGDNSRKGSVGGGYFPEVAHSHQHAPPSAPPPPPLVPPPTAVSPVSPRPPQQAPTTHASDANQYYQTPPRPPVISPHPAQAPYVPSPPPQPYQPPPAQPPPQQYYAPPPPPAPAAVPAASAGGQSYRSDDDSVAAAQKHAKWAISALNFDDPNTAVKELRLALQSLGAQ